MKSNVGNYSKIYPVSVFSVTTTVLYVFYSSRLFLQQIFSSLFNFSFSYTKWEKLFEFFNIITLRPYSSMLCFFFFFMCFVSLNYCCSSHTYTCHQMKHNYQLFSYLQYEIYHLSRLVTYLK
jgi:hypothetical protein